MSIEELAFKCEVEQIPEGAVGSSEFVEWCRERGVNPGVIYKNGYAFLAHIHGQHVFLTDKQFIDASHWLAVGRI